RLKQLASARLVAKDALELRLRHERLGELVTCPDLLKNSHGIFQMAGRGPRIAPHERMSDHSMGNALHWEVSQLSAGGENVLEDRARLSWFALEEIGIPQPHPEPAVRK